jgi:hypothetical protein
MNTVDVLKCLKMPEIKSRSKVVLFIAFTPGTKLLFGLASITGWNLLF